MNEREFSLCALVFLYTFYILNSIHAKQIHVVVLECSEYNMD